MGDLISWCGIHILNAYIYEEEEEEFTWNVCESIPVEKVAITIAHIAIRKPCKPEKGTNIDFKDQEIGTPHENRASEVANICILRTDWEQYFSQLIFKGFN